MFTKLIKEGEKTVLLMDYRDKPSRNKVETYKRIIFLPLHNQHQSQTHHHHQYPPSHSILNSDPQNPCHPCYNSKINDSGLYSDTSKSYSSQQSSLSSSSFPSSLSSPPPPPSAATVSDFHDPTYNPFLHRKHSNKSCKVGQSF